jgi:hypothetical protein
MRADTQVSQANPLYSFAYDSPDGNLSRPRNRYPKGTLTPATRFAVLRA